MKRARIIPVLLLHQNGLYKTTKFGHPKYIGDPINAVKIFNEKQCDELIILDIEASKKKSDINYKLIEEIASECFMPLTYGGGIKSLNHIEQVLKLGVEKVVFNTIAINNPQFIVEATKHFASSSIVVSVDIQKKLLGQYRVMSHCNQPVSITNPLKWIQHIENAGAGEVLVNIVDLDGTFKGYDIDFYKKLTDQIGIPIIACGGCTNIQNAQLLLTQTQTSAAAAGSMFVFHGKHNAVLISYPEPETIENIYMHG
jgi:imidazole glycerol-phosphate synthase subunit HisF